MMGSGHKTDYFLLICFCLFLGLNAAIDSISVNESIRDSEVLVSSGQNFKLGFFSPENSSYRYVGVLYNVPVKTVIWVANRDRPLYDSDGRVELLGDGNLVILDGRMEIVWSSNLSSSVANSSARLLDTGNLVLQDSSTGRILWESFQHASDSFVEEMKLATALSTNEKNTLTSWRSTDDPSMGRFTVTVEPLNVPQLFVWNGKDPYWRSGPWDGQVFIGLHGMNSFYENGLDLVNFNPGNSYLTFYNLNSSVLYYSLSASGILKQKVWSDKKGDWEVTWSSMQNECDIHGKCGPFGSCNAQETPICSCLPGFEPKNNKEWNAANWTSGCTRKTPLQCPKNISDNEAGKEDGFLKLKTMKLPDQVKWLPTFEANCRNQCLNNCSCIAYACHDGIGCMMWTEILIDVQKFSSGGSDLYIRLADAELGNKKNWNAVIITTIVLGCLTLPVCTFFLWKWLVKYKGNWQRGKLLSSVAGEIDPKSSKESRPKYNVHRVKAEELPLFKFVVLSNATENFGSINKLGEGGFGPVYKGKLTNGEEIAVKRLAVSSNQGLEEFMNEVEVISKLQHRNLVKLLGCCVESKEKMLVYEYMPNKSLDFYLFDLKKQAFLDWRKRAIIVEGICRGLVYLHRDSRLRIIHRDLKASNILLDEELNPKISDFGLARIFGGKEDQAKTARVVGTYGYMAPEYALQGRFSEKSDVFSFGVLLLEIVSGRRNSSFRHEEQALSLIGYAWKLWSEERMVNLIDKVIYDPQMEQEIVRYAHVGLLCVQEMAKNRPNISTVLSMLSHEIVELPCPGQPAFTVNQIELSDKSPSKSSFNDVTLTIIEGR